MAGEQPSIQEYWNDGADGDDSIRGQDGGDDQIVSSLGLPSVAVDCGHRTLHRGPGLACQVPVTPVRF